MRSDFVKRQKSKRTVGPKFDAYLEINMNLVKREYVLLLVYGIFWGMSAGADSYLDLNEFIIYFLLLVLLFMFSGIPKLCDVSLYQEGAALFQSVPVTSYETVLAKSIAGAAGLVIPVPVFLFFLIGTVTNDEEKWYEFYDFLMDAGFQRENIVVGAVLAFWTAVALAPVISGICFLAFTVGNRFRGRSVRWRKWLIAVAVMAVLLAVAAGLLWLIWMVSVLPVLARLAFIMAAAVVLSVVLVRLNMAALEKWYSI